MGAGEAAGDMRNSTELMEGAMVIKRQVGEDAWPIIVPVAVAVVIWFVIAALGYVVLYW